MPPPLSVQLYSLRAETAVDPEGVIRRLGDIGYAGVEPAGLMGLTPERLRHVVEDAGMVISSAHTALPTGPEASAVLDEQEALGNRLLIASGGRDEFDTVDHVRRVADRFNDAAVTAGGRGMAVGYHNHGWEFAPLPDGRSPYDVLQEHLDPSVFLQVDVYWVRVGGADPTTVVRAAGDRVRSLHVKDGPLVPPSPMTACGDGAMDLASPIAAAEHAEWHVVELDECATDMVEAVERSHRYLVGAGLSSGR